MITAALGYTALSAVAARLAFDPGHAAALTHFLAASELGPEETRADEASKMTPEHRVDSGADIGEGIPRAVAAVATRDLVPTRAA